MKPRTSFAPITQLLFQWKGGDETSFDQLIEIVYDELYKRARHYLGRGDHRQFSCTALVNEAYLQLVEEKDRNWQNRDHFFSVAALIMRHLITRFAQMKKADKRGGKAVVVAPRLDELQGETGQDLLAIDESFNALEKIEPRMVRAVELVYLVGLKHQEAAKILKISVATLKRDLSFASAWLERHIQGD